MAEHLTHEQDVLVIGAGGAGLRAAAEASAAGVKVAVITKSLLGKAHTVMAEGGIAAALANVDDRRPACESWKPGALSSIAPPMGASCNAISAAIAIRAWRMWAIARVSR